MQVGTRAAAASHPHSTALRSRQPCPAAWPKRSRSVARVLGGWGQTWVPTAWHWQVACGMPLQYCVATCVPVHRLLQELAKAMTKGSMLLVPLAREA